MAVCDLAIQRKPAEFIMMLTGHEVETIERQIEVTRMAYGAGYSRLTWRRR
jgi:hypothetical protein